MEAKILQVQNLKVSFRTDHGIVKAVEVFHLIYIKVKHYVLLVNLEVENL